MAPSSNSFALLDRAALAGIAAGIAGYIAPVWSEGRLKYAFWVTLAATLLHIYTSHKGAHVGDEGGGS